MHSQFRRRTAAVVTAVALMTGCAGNTPAAAPATTGSQPATTGSGGDTVRYAAPGSPSNAVTDPHGLLPGESDMVRMALTYDVLTVPGADGSTKPRLATEWQPDETLTKWRITIRGDAKFSDGRPVKAADALFSLRRMGKKAAENFGRMAMFDLDASKVIDDTAFELVTKKPYAEVGKALEGATFVVPEGSDDFGKPVPGSGPFRPTAKGGAQAVVFERNDDWWGPEPPSRFIEVRAVPDPQARAQALLSGQVDLAGGVPATLAKQQEGNSAVRLLRRPGATLYPLVMRMDTEPFDDHRVREAVRLALDRKQLLDTVFLGYGEVGNDLITPKDSSSPANLPERTRDLDRAKKFMADAGLAGGVDLTLHTTTAYPGMDSAATLISQQLADIGIRVKVSLEPADTYFSEIYGRKPFYLSYLGGIPFLDVVRVALTPGSPTNETAWKDPAWFADLDEALAERDDAKRSSLLADLQAKLRDQGGYAIWALSDRLDLAKAELSGVPEGIGFASAFIDQVSLDG
ncbi:ABC transporter substrate-binding protein [Nonomuraea africana]|uniref:ABC transporter substrate-binding protein n=1 Tax=Nonomuraea africana TaxID=46171 RepID=UPI0033DC4477